MVGAVESVRIVTFAASSVPAETVPFEKNPAVISNLSSQNLLKYNQQNNFNYYLTYYGVKFVKIIFSININSGRKLK